jgi:tetratricopeptide (TPR) repeat protein
MPVGSNTRWASTTTRRRCTISAGLCAGLALAAYGCRDGSTSRRNASIVDALGNCRIVEGWLPGASFAPLAADQVRCKPGADAQLVAHRVLERDNEAETNSSLDHAQDGAIALLVLGRRDEAIARLERVPPDKATATVLITLAAAYLEDAARDAAASALAVDLSERAARLEPGRREAWFNRALALEQLGLTAAATAAWQDYLARDGESDWAKEARQRQSRGPVPAPDWPRFRDQLVTGSDVSDTVLLDMVSRATDRCRELLEDDVLRGWAEAVLADSSGNDNGPASRLRSARRLAASLYEVRGDRTFLDQVQHIETSSRTPPGAIRMARATLAWIRARAAIDRGDAEVTRRDLAIARQAFTGPSGAADPIDFYSLMVDYYRADYAKAIGALKRLTRNARSRHHTYVEARCTFVLAAIAVRQARVSDALVLYRQATELFARGGETGYLASAQAIVSVRHREQGDRAAAWNQLREALALLHRIDTPRHLTAVLRTGQTAAVEQRLSGLAVHFTSALVELSERSQNANTLIPALADQGRQQVLTRDVEGARRSLQGARTALSRVTDPNMGTVLASMIARAEAVLLAQTSPCDAAASLSDAIDTVTRVVPNQLATTFLERGRAQRACGRIDEAIADFRSGIRILEEQRGGQRGAQLRISRFDQVWDLYGELIGLLALHRGQSDQALLVSEQSRARELAEALGGGTGTGTLLNVAQLQASIPDRTTAVSYVVLPIGAARSWTARTSGDSAGVCSNCSCNPSPRRSFEMAE